MTQARMTRAGSFRQDRASPHQGPAHRDHRTQRLARRLEAGQHAARRQRAAEAAARADRRPAAGARRHRHGADRGGAATGGARRRSCCSRPRRCSAPAQRARGFEPAHSQRHASASPPATTSTRCSCPNWWRASRQRRRACALELLPLSADYDYRQAPGPRRGRPRDRQLARAARRAAPGRACSATRSSAWCATTIRRGAQPARLDRCSATSARACGADADARRCARRHRRAPRPPGPGSASIVVRSRALRADPADGGADPAGADHRAPVLQPLCRRAAGCASCAARSPSRR